MFTSKEREKLRMQIYCSASLSRVLGMINAFLEGKKNCTMNWIFGQITKAHNLNEAKVVLDAFEKDFESINKEKLIQLRTKLSI